MVKSPELVAVFEPTVTDILPVEAPEGTVAISWVVLPELREAVVPLNLTMLELSVELKLVPEIVTVVPTTPKVGVNVEMVGRIEGSATVVRMIVTCAEFAP